MRFGMLYELQLPKPWAVDSEQRLVDHAIEQCVLGDRLGLPSLGRSYRGPVVV